MEPVVAAVTAEVGGASDDTAWHVDAVLTTSQTPSSGFDRPVLVAFAARVPRLQYRLVQELEATQVPSLARGASAPNPLSVIAEAGYCRGLAAPLHLFLELDVRRFTSRMATSI